MEKKIEFREHNEIRAVDTEDESMVIEGVVNNVGEFSKVIYGEFREKINPGVFEKSIKDAKDSNRDIFFLALHNNRELPLASMFSDTLELREEKGKLLLRAELPPTSLAKDIYQLVKAKVLREFSFGFSNAKADWGTDKDGIRTRTITSLDLNEVSIVKVGAYNDTNAQARSIEDILQEIPEEKDKDEEEREYQYNANKLKLYKMNKD